MMIVFSSVIPVIAKSFDDHRISDPSLILKESIEEVHCLICSIFFFSERSFGTQGNLHNDQLTTSGKYFYCFFLPENPLLK